MVTITTVDLCNRQCILVLSNIIFSFVFFSFLEIVRTPLCKRCLFLKRSAHKRLTGVQETHYHCHLCKMCALGSGLDRRCCTTYEHGRTEPYLLCAVFTDVILHDQ